MDKTNLKKKQKKFFNKKKEDIWKEEWQDMPEFVQKEAKAYQEIKIRFYKAEDVDAFAKLIEQKISRKTKYLWFPKMIHSEGIGQKYIHKKINIGK